MKKGLLFIGIIVVFVIITYTAITSMYGKNIIFSVYNELESNIENADEDVKVEYGDFSNISASIPIFMYHWIKDDTGDYPYPENMVKPAELRKQMEYLDKNNYDVIFVTDIENIHHYDKPVILTFDDGWHDVYAHAFPIAKELNMKFCMYIISDMVGEPGYCTVEELQEMLDSGLVQIDAHTNTHPRLGELERTKVIEELSGSKEYILEKFGIDSKVICYPYGSTSQLVMTESRKLFDYGLLMDGGVFMYKYGKSDMLGMQRIYAMRSMTIDTFSNYCKRSKVTVE